MIFNEISSSIRTPGNYAEFNASNARPDTTEKPNAILLIGTKLSGGSMTVETIYPLTGGAPQADALAGVGSPLAEMGRWAVDTYPEAEIYMIAATEPSGGTAATGSLVFTGTATADGYIYPYVAGVPVTPVRVTSGDTAATVATAVYNAINAQSRLPTSSANGTSATTSLTAKWKGVAGNDILVELNRNSNEALPAGLACTVNTMTGGAGVPAIATTIAAFGSDWYARIVSQFNDDATLDAIEAEAAARWTANVAMDTVVFAAYRGTYGNTVTYGQARNSPLSTVAAIELSPTAPWVAAAIYGATAASEKDPARPLNTLALRGIVPPKKSQRFTRTQRDALLHYGMTTTKVVSDVVTIERAVTTYQTNTAGLADDTYLDITTPQTLAYLRWSRRNWLMSRYPRHKLADNGTRADPDQPVVTPDMVAGETIAWGEAMERKALIEDFPTFKSSLKVVRNGPDRNRVDTFCAPNLVNGAHIFADIFGFIL